MSGNQNIIPKIIAGKSEDFKQIFADGAYTWFGGDSGTITFFTDSADPSVDDKGNLQVKTVQRKFSVEIRMTHEMYASLIDWMIDRKKAFEESQKDQK